MKKYFKFIKEDRLLKRLFIVSLILIVLTGTFAILTFSKLPPLLPIFNQLSWGEDRLSPAIGIFIPLLLAIIIYVNNLIFSAISYQISPLISRLFAVTTFLTSFIAFLFTVRTVILIS